MFMNLVIENNSTFNFKKELFIKKTSIAEEVLNEEIIKLKINDKSSINLLITNNKEIAHYNEKYRNKKGPTDVLAFSYLEGTEIPGDEDIIGDVIISAETANTQAKERKVSIEDEMQFLYVHGLLHLLGYDHDTPKRKKEMFELTDEIMEKKLPVYS